MAYTPIDKSTDYFNTSLWTGNAAEAGDGSTQAITGVGFQPDWTWIKKRSATGNHHLVDVVRGITKELRSNLTNAEADDNQIITAYGSDGFTLGSSGSGNLQSATYVGWTWKAGTSFTNDASSTSVGSIDSAGSVSTTAGFSIMSYTGTGSAATFAHGLGAVPKMIIFKNRTAAGSQWDTYHHSVGTAHRLYLDSTSAKSSATNFINDTAPTSSVISVGDATHTNGDGNSHIAYCFAEVQGFSKFGEYKGNNANDGPMVHTGFKPAFMMIKRTDGADDWKMVTQKVEVHNTMNSSVKANTNAAEAAESDHAIDLLSNGFKLRENNAAFNAAGTYIYMAFASNPFVTSTGIPTTAL